jgi:hypothetical protein
LGASQSYSHTLIKEIFTQAWITLLKGCRFAPCKAILIAPDLAGWLISNKGAAKFRAWPFMNQFGGRNEHRPKTAVRFLPLDFLRFLESSFSSTKLRVLIVETISFPVSFPFVSRFRAIGCCDGNERHDCPVKA